MDQAKRVLTRFRAATAESPAELEDEITTLEELKSQLESFIFMEGEALQIRSQFARMSRDYPDLHATAREAQGVFGDFIDVVLHHISGITEDIDEAIERREEQAGHF